MITTINKFNETILKNITNTPNNIFKFDSKSPYDFPNDIYDTYVSRTDGKIGTSNWEQFKQLLLLNIGKKLATYAYSNRIYVFEMLKDGRILTAEYHILK